MKNTKQNGQLRVLGGLLLVLVMLLTAAPVAHAAEAGVQEARSTVVRTYTAATVKYWGTHEDTYAVSGTGFFVGEQGEAVQYVVSSRQLFDSAELLEEVKKLDAKYAQAQITDIRVWVLIDGQAYPINYVNGVTLSQIADLAILKLSEPVTVRSAAVLGDADELDSTDRVYAIGFPNSSDMEDSNNAATDSPESRIVKDYPSRVGNMSVTEGYVVKNHVVIGGIDHVQHAAAISGGNSGGPLLLSDGSVVGMNTQINEEETETANFAIDVSFVKTFLRQNGVSYVNAADLVREQADETAETDPAAGEAEEADLAAEETEETDPAVTEPLAEEQEEEPDTSAITEEGSAEAEGTETETENETTEQTDGDDAEDTADDSGSGGNEDEEDDESNYLLWGGIGGGILAVLILIAVLMKKRKSEDKPVTDHSETSTEPTVSWDDLVGGSETETIPTKENAQTEIRGLKKTGTVTIPQKKTRKLTFTTVGHDRLSFTLDIEEKRDLTHGRDKRADLILNTDDKSLSGVHCQIRFENNELLVKDAGSKNGTFVNGIQLQPGSIVRMADGDTLRVGNYEYRVQLQEIT